MKNLMKKLTAALLGAALLTASFAGCASNAGEAGGDKKLNVGIVQLMEHPSLNTIRESFLEEMKALGKNIPGSLIKNLKTSFMGPLAGLGDTIWQGVFLPVLLVICIDVTHLGGGNIYGVLLYTVVTILTACVFSYQNLATRPVRKQF